MASPSEELHLFCSFSHHRVTCAAAAFVSVPAPEPLGALFTAVIISSKSSRAGLRQEMTERLAHGKVRSPPQVEIT